MFITFSRDISKDVACQVLKLCWICIPYRPPPRVLSWVDQTRGLLHYVEENCAKTGLIHCSGPSLRARFVGQGYKHVCGRADMWYLRFQLILKVHLILASTVFTTRLLVQSSDEETRPWYMVHRLF